MNVDNAITFFNKVNISKTFLDNLNKYSDLGYTLDLNEDGDVQAVKDGDRIIINSTTGEVNAKAINESPQNGDSKNKGRKGTKKRRKVEEGGEKDL